MHFDWKKILPYLAAIVVFLGISVVYCAPMLEGKVLYAGDTNNWKGSAQEARQYNETTGETTWWTNSQFGGMPTYQFAGNMPSTRLSNYYLRSALRLGLPETMGIIFCYFLGFFLMLRCFKVNRWLSIAGALAIGLSSYFFLIIPAGHVTKAIALGFLAPLFGGIYAIFRKQYWLGTPLVIIYGIAGFVLHPQMTYYMGMMIGICCLAELYIHIREKRWKDLGIAVAILAGSLLIVGGSKASWFQMNQEYLKETMRGGHSELTQPETAAAQPQSGGLDIDYATAWSYGKAETLTLLIPNYMGGCSGYNLGEGSLLEKNLKKMGVPARQAKGFCKGAPTYWGEKAFTSGPVYVGAIICFLFILGLIIVPGPYKWALLASTILSVLLAWGRNFMPLTEFFYNYVPMYNKFRAVESILVVAEVTIPLLGFLAIKQLSEMEDRKKARNMIGIAGGITAAVCLFVALFGGGFDVTSSYDAQWKGQVGNQIYEAILDQRHAMMQADAWRSLVFVLLGAAVLLVYNWKKEAKNSTLLLSAALGVLILIDMLPVDKRFFNNDNFVSERESNGYFAMQPWEEQILQDKSLDYRVLNVATNTFNDSRTSYRLKSIGGYSAVKLRRYQDLIDAHISKNNMQVLNMLNTKYFVTREGVVQNPSAFGNAWFVDSLLLVDTPDEESAALNMLDLRKTAVADKRFADALDITKPEYGVLMAFDTCTVTMDSYAPNRLEYTARTEQNKVAVFSEIYYPNGWHLYIDGAEAPLARVNYVLRAAVIPSGEHKIVMEFVPDGKKIDIWATILLIAGLILSLTALLSPLYGKALKSRP